MIPGSHGSPLLAGPSTITSSDDRLNGALLPGWRTKITVSVAHLSIYLDQETDQQVEPEVSLQNDRNGRGLIQSACGRKNFALNTIVEPRSATGPHHYITPHVHGSSRHSDSCPSVGRPPLTCPP